MTAFFFSAVVPYSLSGREKRTRVRPIVNTTTVAEIAVDETPVEFGFSRLLKTLKVICDARKLQGFAVL